MHHILSNGYIERACRAMWPKYYYAKLGELCGVSRETARQYTNGTRTMPLDHLRKLQATYNAWATSINQELEALIIKQIEKDSMHCRTSNIMGWKRERAQVNNTGVKI